MHPSDDDTQEGYLNDSLFEQNDFGSQIKEELDLELLQLLDDEFDTN
jgi:hypothetical protein